MDIYEQQAMRAAHETHMAETLQELRSAGHLVASRIGPLVYATNFKPGTSDGLDMLKQICADVAERHPRAIENTHVLKIVEEALSSLPTAQAASLDLGPVRELLRSREALEILDCG